MKKLIKSKKFLIISVVIVLITGFLITDNYIVNKKREDNIKSATVNFEETSISAIKATLDLFYLKRGQYPLDINELKDYFEETKESTEVLNIITTKLKDFEYKMRGDRQAAQMSYTDTNGNKQIINFNYKNDFN